MKRFGPIQLPLHVDTGLRSLRQKLEVHETIIARVILEEVLKDHALMQRLLRAGLGDLPGLNQRKGGDPTDK